MKNIPRTGKRYQPKTAIKGKRYRCATCHKRSPRPVWASIIQTIVPQMIRKTSCLVASLAIPWFAPPEILSLKVATLNGGRSMSTWELMGKPSSTIR